ncbi:MAG: ferric reductase-like transmembrane domain-containing protein [Gemmatimonadota bacterium]|nr:ferric reductase-like transmembrane domain-containing protein [Gemmatimonadota bacterium]
MRYNPWRQWPHRRVNYFRVHNWTGYTALAIAVLHPVLLFFSSDAHFRLLDVVIPLWAPKQPIVNAIGALSLYALLLVIVTSYYRPRMNRMLWKRFHYVAYGSAALFYLHGLLSDPSLKDAPVDWLDAEKVSVELCLFLVVAAGAWRLRWGLRHARITRARSLHATETADAR